MNVNVSLCALRRQTILCRLDTMQSDAIHYQPGDHVGIFPTNRPDIVNIILRYTSMEGDMTPDDLIKPEVMEEQLTPMGQCAVVIFVAGSCPYAGGGGLGGFEPTPPPPPPPPPPTGPIEFHPSWKSQPAS